MSEKKSFGGLIRAKRKEQNLKIKELSARCGISNRGYGNIELGHASPKLDHLLSIAAALDIDLGELNYLKPEAGKSES